MALTSNSYTGNGSTVLFSFTFPYLDTADIKVSLNGVVTTAYTLANATTIQFNTAPANGVAIKIYRATSDSLAVAEFYPGSAIRSTDLNNNFTQNLYVTQEANNASASAVTTAAGAVTTANTALSQSSAAVNTANTASANASSAVTTANTASTNASAAVSTANTASSNASTAVTTANSAVTTANTKGDAAIASAATANTTAASAVTTANAATTTANTASSNAASAVSTANTASTTAGNAVTTANSAVTTANGAVTTANNAVTTANSAQTAANNAVVTSNLADTKANQAIAAVASSINYTLVANVAAIPSSPTNGLYIEIGNSTGLESFTPLAGLPVGFVGDAGLSARLVYQTSNSSWNWLTYFANNSETRYLKLAGGTLTGTLAHPLGAAATPSIAFTGDTNTGIYSPGADQVAISTGGTGRLLIGSAGTVTQTLAAASNNGFAINNGTNDLIAIGAGGFAANGGSVTDGGIRTTNNLVFATGSGAPERLRITSAGLVGVGTSSPNGQLHVEGGQTYMNRSGAGNQQVLQLNNSDTTAGTQIVKLAFGSSGATKASINAAVYGNDYLAFNTGSDTERMRLTGTGLGIGTSAPTAPLEVFATVNSELRLNTSADGYLQIGQFANGASIGTSSANATAGALRFVTAGSEKARFDTSGRLGIGTSSPSQRLHVVGTVQSLSTSTTVADNVGFFAGNGGDGSLLNGITFQGSYISNLYLGRSASADDLVVRNGSAELVRVTNAGRVGIGTTSPGTSLHCSSGSVDIATFQRSSAGADAALMIVDSNSTGAYINTAGGANVVFATRSAGTNSERARIDSSGRLGIGTSAVNDRLEVNGVVRSAFGANTTNTVQGAYRFNNPIYPNQFAAIYGYTTASASDQIELAFLTSGSTGVPTERMRLTQTGLGIGTTGPSTTLHVVSNTTQALFEGATQGNINIQKVGTNGFGIYSDAAGTLNFYDNNSALLRLKLDSSGRLLVGTSTARSNFFNAPVSSALGVEVSTDAQIEFSGIRNRNNVDGAAIVLAKSRGTTAGSNTIVTSGDAIGRVSFQGSDGSEFVEAAVIQAEVDGTPGANDMPGRLVFSTTADGAASPTERFRITSTGAQFSVIPGGSTIYPQFACRAWVNFNGTGAVAIRASGNVDYITDNAPGDYTVNFITAMPDANYCAVVTGSSTNSGSGCTVMDILSSTAPTASAIRVLSETSGGNNADSEFSNVAIFR